MRKILYSLVIVLVIVLVGSATRGEAAMNIYLSLGGESPTIKGESMDDNHRDWIDVLSINHQIEQSGIDYSTGRTSGKASFGDIVIVKRADRASPILRDILAKGARLPEAIIEMVVAGTKEPLIKFKLTDVMISSVSFSFATGQEMSTEEVSLMYGKIEFIYSRRTPDGRSMGAMFQWNIMTNAPK